MKTSLPTLPLAAMALLSLTLFLLDFAFDSPPETYAAFVPLLLWAVILVVRGRV